MKNIELTNALRKMITGLGSAKKRNAGQCFIAEGTRCVLEIMGSLRCRYLVATPEWVAKWENKVADVESLIVVAQSEITKLSQQKSPQPVLAVFSMPQPCLKSPSELKSGLYLALDCVQDPGNLGTIIRLADWFGITDIICSRDTADAFNPKVVQATMGALVKVEIHYVNLADFLRNVTLPVYGTFLDGDNLYESDLSADGIIVMGNEGNGISPEVADAITRRVLIPPFPDNHATVESLNVGVATAITVAEFRRRYVDTKRN